MFEEHNKWNLTIIELLKEQPPSYYNEMKIEGIAEKMRFFS